MRKTYLAIALCAAALGATGASATTLKKLSLKEAAQKAEVGVVAVVSGQETRLEEGSYVTLTTFSVTDVAFGEAGEMINGTYELAVPKGSNYRILMEALDGDPAATSNISLNAILGGILGQAQFPEEFYNKNQEGAIEFRPDRQKDVSSSASGIDLINNIEIKLANHDRSTEFVGTGAIAGATKVTYAEVFDGQTVLDQLRDSRGLVSANVRTGTLDSSIPVEFTSLRLVTGRQTADGQLEIVREFQRGSDYGQDGDSAPVVFNNSKGLARSLQNALRKDDSLDVILFATGEGPVGPSGFAPIFVGIDIDSNAGTSFFSIDDGPFTEYTPGNWIMDLNFVPKQ